MKLKHVATLQAGGTPDTNRADFWTDEGGVPWVAIGDMSSGRPVLRTTKQVTAAGLADRSLSPAPAGTVLFAMYASVGAVSTLVVDAVWNQALIGVAPIDGRADSRFLAYWLRHFGSISVGEARTATQANLNADQVANFPFPEHALDQQRRIADFLDDRVARIDQIIATRSKQHEAIDASLVRASFDAVKGLDAEHRRDSGLAWLGSVPASWPILTVATEFQVDLGKMLDEKRQTGASAIPYLRNTNVQWDQVDTSDLKIMDIAPDERERYGVRPGDLLICEGGQPGRSAVWRGRMTPLGYQKALHRARSRGRSRPEWLLECLRVAVHLNVFAVENGQTTIGHLTNEQLRSLRLPFPEPETQDGALAGLQQRQENSRGVMAVLSRSMELLQEYKQSLITAAVTGEIDVTTAGSGIPG